MMNNINHFKELVDQAWEKHSHGHFRAPTAHDMEILIKTCLMPLALKTQNDSFTFIHELKQEMHADLKYVESLEKEINELESDKAEFSNMYDILLQECVSNDVMCSYLHSLSDLDANTELQCLYVHKIKEYLKAQLQDKNIAISELKKLIEKMKGKSVDTGFEKQSILRKLPLQPIKNQPVAPREFVGSNDMVHNYYLEEAKKKAQLQKDKALNTKPSLNWPPSMSSRVLNRTVNIAEPPGNQKPFFKSKDLACPTCKKCIYSAKHDECILKYLSKILIGQKFSPNKSFNVYLKPTPPRSGLTWKPPRRIFTHVGLKWIPIRKSVETCYNTNDSASPLGKKTHNPNTTICANSSSLSAGTSMAYEPISSKGSSNVNIL
ncbi:hypothetical protein Tco_1332168 [Tanacetum coccineum]